jgi:predicted small secreted protein
METLMIRAFLIGLALFTLTACETAKGAGKDIENAGDAIQNAATDVQENL